jgi:hypothetical protein
MFFIYVFLFIIILYIYINAPHAESVIRSLQDKRSTHTHIRHPVKKQYTQKKNNKTHILSKHINTKYSCQNTVREMW